MECFIKDLFSLLELDKDEKVSNHEGRIVTILIVGLCMLGFFHKKHMIVELTIISELYSRYRGIILVLSASCPTSITQWS